MIGYNRPHWSVSSLRQLQSCPLAWRLSRIDRVAPSHRSPGLVLGSVYHQVLAHALSALRDGEDVPKEALRLWFIDLWQAALEDGAPVRWTSRATEESERALGVQLIEAWHDQALPVFKEAEEIEGVELSFTVPLIDSAGEITESPLTGIADAILRQPDGRVVVVDHKTSSQGYGETFIDSDLQATAYVYAARQLGFGEAQFVYHVMSKSKKGPTLSVIEAPRTEGDFDRLFWIASQAERLVAHDIYLPSPPGWQCESCEYAGACRKAHKATGVGEAISAA
jgi:RecB family exonuclease